MAYIYTVVGILLFAVGVPLVNAISSIITSLGDWVSAVVAERIAIINISLQKYQDELESDGETAVIGFSVDSDEMEEEYEDD